ncbi:MAG: SRPBCC family protein [Acidimicrobiia bacterium]
MSVDVTTSITIARPVEVVAAYAIDPDNAPEWYENIEAVEWVTTPPLEEGSQVAFVARFLGRRLAYTYEFMDVRPGEQLIMRTAQGPFPMETTYTWSAPGPALTLMTLRNRGEPAGFSKVTAPIMASAMKRANHKDLARLRSILEGR